MRLPQVSREEHALTRPVSSWSLVLTSLLLLCPLHAPQNSHPHFAQPFHPATLLAKPPSFAAIALTNANRGFAPLESSLQPRCSRLSTSCKPLTTLGAL